jgi:hypothetical protein
MCGCVHGYFTSTPHSQGPAPPKNPKSAESPSSRSTCSVLLFQVPSDACRMRESATKLSVKSWVIQALLSVRSIQSLTIIGTVRFSDLECCVVEYLDTKNPFHQDFISRSHTPDVTPYSVWSFIFSYRNPFAILRTRT